MVVSYKISARKFIIIFAEISGKLKKISYEYSTDLNISQILVTLQHIVKFYQNDYYCRY